MADLVKLEDRAGVRMFERGFRARSWANYLLLPTSNSLWNAVNSEVKKQTVEAVDEFGGQFSWREFWWAVREPSASYDWSMHCNWEPQLVLPQVVSLHRTYLEFTGGAHGNSGFGALNAVANGSSLREVALADLFHPDTAWRVVLAAHAAEQINRQKRARWGGDFTEELAVTVAPHEMEDAVFTLTAEGIRLWFAPYEKGAYAEGSFDPLVPYDAIVHLLDTNGPARWLPTW